MEAMNIADEIAKLYNKHAALVPGRTFEQDLALHALHGYVWASPTSLVLAKPTHSSFTARQVAEKWIKAEEADCWFVYLAAGDLSEFFRVWPHRTQHVCFYRRGKLKFYSLERMESLATAEKALAKHW